MFNYSSIDYLYPPGDSGSQKTGSEICKGNLLDEKTLGLPEAGIKENRVPEAYELRIG